MKKAVVWRHLAFEDLGLLSPILHQHGYDITYQEAGVDTLTDADADLLVVLGGPIGVNDAVLFPWLADEIAVLKMRLLDQRPTLGICLGAQLIAAALGAPVTPMGHKEIGFYPLTLTDAGQQSLLAIQGPSPVVLHWHGDHFAIPSGASHLASSELCPEQAFSFGKQVLALQFHLETDLQRLEQWLVGHSGELLSAGINFDVLRRDADIHCEKIELLAASVFGEWLDQLT